MMTPVSSFHDALDLAAALIKVSRLGPVESSGELTMALLHSSTALMRECIGWSRGIRRKSHKAVEDGFILCRRWPRSSCLQ